MLCVAINLCTIVRCIIPASLSPPLLVSDVDYMHTVKKKTPLCWFPLGPVRLTEPSSNVMFVDVKRTAS